MPEENSYETMKATPYHRFYPEQIPFAKVYRWEVKARDKDKHILHLPPGINGSYKTQEAAETAALCLKIFATGKCYNDIAPLAKTVLDEFSEA
jgi:hypothetical protein